jgi:hypothetical protein
MSIETTTNPAMSEGFTFSSKSCVIEPGKNFVLPVSEELLQLGPTLLYSFCAADEEEITFSVHSGYVPTDEEIEDAVYDMPLVMEPFTHVGEVHGSVEIPAKATAAGESEGKQWKVVLVWDNTESWFGKRHLTYTVNVGMPHDNAQRLLRTVIAGSVEGLRALVREVEQAHEEGGRSKAAAMWEHPLRHRDAQGHNVLLMAARNGKAELVRWLIDSAGMNPFVVGHDGANALHWAVVSGNFELTEWLLCQVGVDPMFPDNDGNHCTHYAACCGETRVLGLLRREGSLDLLERNYRGWDALTWATEKQQPLALHWIAQHLERAAGGGERGHEDLDRDLEDQVGVCYSAVGGPGGSVL